MKAYLVFAPHDTPDSRLVEVAGIRWTVEMCFKESKGEVGLDQYEVRNYDSWYKHISFAMAALAFITVLASNSLDTKTLQQHNPGLSSLDDFKKGRNLRLWANLTFVKSSNVFTDVYGYLALNTLKSGLFGVDNIKLSLCGIIIINLMFYYCNIRVVWGFNVAGNLYRAVNHGQDEIDKIIKQAKDILQWFDNMQNPIPTWYLKDFYVEWVNSVPISLKKPFDFSFINKYGTVFKIVDNFYGSGNICFGVENDGKKYFIKFAGAPKEKFNFGTTEQATNKTAAV